jgi:predicted outer membrane lipoprotein
MVAIVLGILLAMAIAILNRLFSSGVIATGKRNRRYK